MTPSIIAAVSVAHEDIVCGVGTGRGLAHCQDFPFPFFYLKKIIGGVTVPPLPHTRFFVPLFQT